MQRTPLNKKLKLSFNLFVLALILFTSCKKEEPQFSEPETVTTEIANGLPANSASIHGYFYASYRRQSAFSTDGYYVAQAQFGDPARDLMGNFEHLNEFGQFNGSDNGRPNVQVNNVFFNNRSLIKSNGFNPYQLVSSGSQDPFSPQVTWKIEGNKTFVGFEKVIPRGFPEFASAVKTFTAYLHEDGFVLNTPPTFVVHYDSLIVSIGYGTGELRKGVLQGNNVFIPKNELQHLSSPLPMRIKLFNYSHFTLKDKVYVFEQANEATTTLYIYP